MTDDVLLRAAGVCRSFRMGRETITVLDGLDLELRRGERVSVVGASGSGKTTMINMLGLLDQPDAGRIELLGSEASSLSGARRTRLRNGSLGFVFQFYHLIHELTALENVYLPAMIAGDWTRHRAAAIERARELLDAVGLGDRIRHRPNEMSGGERQRVAIARALINRPAVIFCDEPTGNLDPRTSGGVQELLFSLGADDRAMLLVTHDERFARRCDRVLRLIDGRLVPADEPAPATGGAA